MTIPRVLKSRSKSFVEDPWLEPSDPLFKQFQESYTSKQEQMLGFKPTYYALGTSHSSKEFLGLFTVKVHLADDLRAWVENQPPMHHWQHADSIAKEVFLI